MSFETVTSHVSTFSSSLVIKALASYLFFVLIQSTQMTETRPASTPASIDHLLLETERLCPPIIGVLRRVLDHPWKVNDEVSIPPGWDVWLYFPLINRDIRTYGSDARLFVPDRWKDRNLPLPLTFGSGSKRCLGVSMVRRIAGIVVDKMLLTGSKVVISSDLEPSMLDFLGWQVSEEGGEAELWQAVKQLPVQRSRKPVMVQLGRAYFLYFLQFSGWLHLVDICGEILGLSSPYQTYSGCTVSERYQCTQYDPGYNDILVRVRRRIDARSGLSDRNDLGTAGVDKQVHQAVYRVSHSLVPDSSAVMYAAASAPNKIRNPVWASPPSEREKVTMTTKGQEIAPPQAVKCKAMVGYRLESKDVMMPPDKQATDPTVPTRLRLIADEVQYGSDAPLTDDCSVGRHEIGHIIGIFQL
ncbi:MAG: hypothetical protein Q9228_007806 [Teloschistes exilis]